MKKLSILLIAFSHLFFTQAQNLILNPGCDDTLVAGEIPNWIELKGNDWTQRMENPDPQGGTGYFFPGVASIAELGQSIDISPDFISY